MAVTSYVPADGPKVGSGTYYFPREFGDNHRGTQMDESTINKHAMMDGSHNATGSKRLFIESGTISVTLAYTQDWYRSNGNGINYYTGTTNPTNGNGFQARDKAMEDLLQWVLIGGDGALTLTKSNGDVFTMNALVTTWDIPYTQGQEEVLAQVTFKILSGLMNRASDNSWWPVF